MAQGGSTIALAFGLMQPAGAFAADKPAAVPAEQPAAAPQETPAPAAADQSADDKSSDIVITGFRASLNKALDVKRESVSSVDAIVAEDIAKFPDQNLAESLQRIPGISIQRDGGEGRSITVRGLSGQFTAVRVNGMQALTTTSDGASADRERAFDFNVFASELFSSLVVNKTAEPQLDEGSLGAVVDLNTGNPLAGKRGVTMALSAQGQYNDLSKDLGPRLAGLIGWKSDDDKFGVSLSAAYSKQDQFELGNNSVRWVNGPRFDSVNGTPCFYSAAVGGTAVRNTGGTYTPGRVAACDAVALAFHPRIPRYGQIEHNRERLGITGSIQWAPTDRTKISFDGLWSRYKEVREERWGEVLFRSNERSIDVTDYAIDSNNNLIKATINDAWVRVEHYQRKLNTTFYQFSGNWKQDIGDKVHIELLAGLSKSTADIPQETTIILDDRDAQGYSYDYSNMKSPKLTFGTSVTDPANFQLAEIRDRPSNTTNKFRTVSLKTTWDIADGFKVRDGGVYRRYDFNLYEAARDTVVCPTKSTAAPDVVLGTITCSASNVFGPTAVYGFPVTSALTEIFNLGNAGQPGGNTNSWVVANLPAATGYTKLYARTAVPNQTNIRSVRETDKGFYLQFDAKGDILGLDYAFNGGIRYVATDQSSTGYNSGVLVTVQRTYEDWLPSFNVALYPAKNLILRGAVSKVMTRPSLGNLTPGGSVDGFNYKVSFGNPLLDPFRATALDAAAEWYFAKESVLSVAFFQKNIQSFPLSTTRSGTFASTGLPLSVILASSPAASNPEGQLWTISTIDNATGGRVRGVEIGLQGPFRFLPGFLHNFGGIANATFISSNINYNVNGPATVPNGAYPGFVTSSTLYGLAKRSYNATLYYDDGTFSARASIAYRSGFVDNGSATGNVLEGYDSITNVDASIRYKLTKNFEVSVEGTNLTDAYRYRFVDLATDRNYENNHFGRTFMFGLRYTR
ncbi:MAG: TonB-dependent receptor [Sphingomonadales bacterium]|nr:TonB-dependent receptor [Sphingomonadales bacterium]